MLEQFSTAAHGAAGGLGVALPPKFLIHNEIERGELRVIFDNFVPTPSACYWVVPSERVDFEPAIAFTDWLQGTIRAEPA